MAIYHFTSKIIKRQTGRSSVAAAAYRHADRFLDEQTGIVHDYTNKPDVLYSEILAPDDAPQWIQQAIYGEGVDITQATQFLWNSVEKAEKRIDAQLAREVEFSLPIELDFEQNKALAREFIQHNFVSKGMVADWSIHWDEGNPHVHVMLSLRELTETGFGNKVRAWNAKDLLKEWRASWAEYANVHLARHQIDARIDHRSYAECGIDLIPTIHQGKKIKAMEAAGFSTERYAELKAINQANLQKIAETPEVIFDKLSMAYTTFTEQHVAHELGRYINDKEAFRGINLDTGESNLNVTENEISHLTADNIVDLFRKIEQHEGVFAERHIVEQLLPFTVNAEAFAAALLQVKASPELIALGPGDDGRERFTTRSFFELENQAQDMADGLKQQFTHAIKGSVIRKQLAKMDTALPENRRLSQEQKQAITHITQGADIAIIIGRAGTGKSTSLKAANAIWQQAGFKVHGIALAGIAAEGLEKGAEIASHTIASFTLALAEKRLTLSQNDIVVMDEAGMVDSQSMHAILQAVKNAKAKLVLVGDPAQVQPVGPGAPFRALIERLGFAELTKVYRQKLDWQIEASTLLASGKTTEALALYDKHERIHLADKPLTAMQQLVAKWYEDFTQESISTLILAHRNKDVNDLNLLARQYLTEQGLLEQGVEVATQQGLITLSQGERLLFLKNHQRLGVKNGSLGTVVGIDKTGAGNSLTVRLDAPKGEEGKLITVDTAIYNHITYGYAVSVHKSQGATVDKSYVYVGGKAWFKNLIYVALTRHQLDTHLYADKETFADLKALMRSLNRWGIKDSALDFPYAYALRRNIDESAVINGFKDYMAKGLQSVIHCFGKTKTRENTVNDTKTDNIQQRREDARLVAAYVDTQQQVGRAWQAVQHELHRVGLERLDYKAREFSVIQQTKAYQTLQRFTKESDALAHSIATDYQRYEKAIELHGLQLDKLNKQSERFIQREKVLTYVEALIAHKTILRDKLADEISQNPKAYFATQHYLQIDTQALYQQAKQHQRRVLLTTLTKAERHTFRKVERYHRLSLKAGKGYAEVMIAQKAGMNTATLEAQLKSVVLQRDAMAAPIYAASDKYHKGLDFFEIGTAKKELSQTKANQRWFKLQQHAARHTANESVAHYQQALKEDNLVKRQWYAQLIMQEARAHHGAIVNTFADAKATWTQIRQDAFDYTKQQFVASLPATQQIHFNVVEQYVATKREAKSAWRAVFTHPDYAKWTATEKEHAFTKAKEIAKPAEALAQEILNNAFHCAKALTFYHIEFADIVKAASLQGCCDTVHEYQTVSQKRHTHLARARLALLIIDAAKQHHSALMDAGITWQTVYQDARVLERQALFTQLSFDEKQLLRLSKKYRQVNRQFGKMLSGFKSQTKPSSALQEKVNLIGAKRDKLAAQLQDKRIHLNFMNAFAAEEERNALMDKLLDFNTQKLAQQAEQHTARVTQIVDWQATQANAIKQLNQLLRQQKKTINANHLDDWLTVQQDNEPLNKQITRRLSQYQYALLEAGITPHEARTTFNTLNKAKASIEQLVSLSLAQVKTQHSDFTQEELTKIQNAQRIEAQTKPIAGTLAERYLREHRGIEGALPESFRFHPGLYHFETGKKYPALVVMAKNDHGLTQVVQAIYLDPKTSNKANDLLAPKLTYGSAGQNRLGVLVNKGVSDKVILIAEGPETALSVAQAKPEMTIYTTLGSGNFKRAPIKADTRAVIFCADNDGADSHSQKRIQEVTQQLTKQGISVYQAMPQGVKDFNDVLKAQGVEAIKHYFENTVLLKASKTSAQILEELKKDISSVTSRVAQEINWKQLIDESKPITNTLGERYLREHCGFTHEIGRRIRFHEAVWDNDSQQHYPAIIGVSMGDNLKAKGARVIYLDKTTGKRAVIDKPVQVFNSGENSIVPVQRGHDKKITWHVALSLESALSIAEADSEARVLCADNVSRASAIPFTPRKGQQAILYTDNLVTDKQIDKIAQTLSDKGVDVFITRPEQAKTFHELFITKGKDAIISTAHKAKLFYKAHEAKEVNALLKNTENEFARLDKAIADAKQQPIYGHEVQAREAFERYALKVGGDQKLMQHLQLRNPKLVKRIDAVIEQEYVLSR